MTFMKRYNDIKRSAGACLWCLMMVLTVACTKDIDDTPFFDEDEVTLLAYMEKQEEFSGFVALARQARLNGMLGAYGSYTVFAFTNEALEAYKKEQGMTGFTDEQARRLIEYHILKSILTTEIMGNGGLKETTIAGDYLEASLTDRNEIVLNRRSKIVKRDLKFTNGYMHRIDQVLQPMDLTVKELIWKNNLYSLFKALWERSGFETVYQELQDEKKKTPITLFIVPDEVYHRKGLYTVEDVMNLPAIQNDPQRLLDFVSYHAIQGMNFLNNFEGGNYSTYGKEMISVKVENVYKINKEVVKGDDGSVSERFIPVETALSNMQARNGIYHTLGEVLIPMTPKAEYTFFDFWEQPEMMARPEYKSATIKGIENWEYSKMKVQVTGGQLEYFISSHVPDQNNFYNRDQFVIGGKWNVEFQTPKIAAGKYRMRLAHKNGATRAIVQLFLDGQKVGEPVNMRSTVPTEKDKVIEGVYWRSYVKDVYFDATKEHVLKVSTVVPGAGNMDGIEFEPIN